MRGVVMMGWPLKDPPAFDAIAAISFALLNRVRNVVPIK
jgi:hypothetical protein